MVYGKQVTQYCMDKQFNSSKREANISIALNVYRELYGKKYQKKKKKDFNIDVRACLQAEGGRGPCSLSMIKDVYKQTEKSQTRLSD